MLTKMDTQINAPEHNTIDSKQKVLFVITQSELGGAQRFLRTLVNRLDKNQYKLLVAAGPIYTGHRIQDTEHKSYDLLDQLETEGLKTARLRHLHREIRPLSDLRAILELRKIIKEFKPDTLFLLSSKAGFIGSLAARNIKIPVRPAGESKYRNIEVVYRIGGWAFNDPWPAWKKKLWVFLERISAKWKDVIIVNNKHDLEQAHELKIKPRKEIKLIHNGLDVYKIDFLPKEEARLKLFEKASRQSGRIFNAGIIVGTVANFYPTKGLEYLISAAEHFKNNDDITFVVIGDGTERSHLEHLIADKGLDKKVLLLGQLPDAYRVIPAFDIFILSSVKEGFPWAVIEAMAAKVPVIATRVGATPEIIEDDKNGMLVEPGRPEQIAAKIQDLLANEHLRQERGIQGP